MYRACCQSDDRCWDHYCERETPFIAANLHGAGEQDEELIVPDDCSLVDSHVHVWPDDLQWPTSSAERVLARQACYGDLRESAQRAGVVGAVIISNAPGGHAHSADHNYARRAQLAFPDFFRAVCAISPELESVDSLRADAVVRHHAEQGFVGVSLNLFDHWDESGLGPRSHVVRALFIAAARRDMVVTLTCALSDDQQLLAIEELLSSSPKTFAVIDHFGLFRKSDEDDERAFGKLLILARYPRLFVKISGWMRVSSMAGQGPSGVYADLVPRIESLVACFTSKRVLWGSDMPYGLLGGPMFPGHAAHPESVQTTYSAVCGDVRELLAGCRLSSGERSDLLCDTARALFWERPLGRSSIKL